MSAAPQQTPGRELFVRHARKGGRSVAVIRAVDYGASCVVEAEVYPGGAGASGVDGAGGAAGGGGSVVRPGPYTFADAHAATAFVTEAVEALMYLGCDVQAS